MAAPVRTLPAPTPRPARPGRSRERRVRLRRRGSRIRTLLRAAGGALLAAACGPGGDEAPAAPRPGPPAHARVPAGEGRGAAQLATLDDLAALGYASFDDEAGTADALAGVVHLDRARAQPGCNLWTDEESRVLLAALDGSPVHSWSVPGFDRCETARLLAGGRVAVLSVDQGLALLEADSSLVWRLELTAHHELVPHGAGGFLTLAWEEREHRGRRVRFDRIVHVSAAGEVVGEWAVREHLTQLAALHPPLPLDRAGPPGPEELDKVYDLYHLNSLQVLPPTALGAVDPRFRAGNLLVGARNASLCFVLEDGTGRVLWGLGPGLLDFPHTPLLTEAGTLLVLDNGWHRGSSRVLELDPPSGRILWSHAGEPPASFFTKRRGSVQRLPNGNTLVCEAERGHVFELTPERELVWDFWNPERRGGRRKRIHRMERVPSSLAASLPGAAERR